MMKKEVMTFSWVRLMLYFKIFISILFSINLYANSLAVIVSTDSNINNISKKMLSKIFLAKTKVLPSGERAVLVENTNKDYQIKFYKAISNKNEKQLKKYWTKMIFTGRGQPPKKIESIKEIINFVQGNKNAISYIPYKDVNSDLKILMRIK